MLRGFGGVTWAIYLYGFERPVAHAHARQMRYALIGKRSGAVEDRRVHSGWRYTNRPACDVFAGEQAVFCGLDGL